MNGIFLVLVNAKTNRQPVDLPAQRSAITARTHGSNHFSPRLVKDVVVLRAECPPKTFRPTAYLFWRLDPNAPRRAKSHQRHWLWHP